MVYVVAVLSMCFSFSFTLISSRDSKPFLLSQHWLVLIGFLFSLISYTMCAIPHNKYPGCYNSIRALGNIVLQQRNAKCINVIVIHVQQLLKLSIVTLPSSQHYHDYQNQVVAGTWNITAMLCRKRSVLYSAFSIPHLHNVTMVTWSC